MHLYFFFLDKNTCVRIPNKELNRKALASDHLGQTIYSNERPNTGLCKGKFRRPFPISYGFYTTKDFSRDSLG